MLKKIFNILEYLFTVVSIVLYTGGVLNVIALDGLSEGDADSTDAVSDSGRFAIVKFIYPITYFIAFLLLTRVLGQKSARVAPALVKSLPVTLMAGLTVLSMLWSELPMVTMSRSIALLGTTLFGIYLANRYTLREQLTLLAHACFAIILLSILFAVALPQYGLMGGIHAGAMRGIYTHKNEFGRLMALAAIVFLMQPKALSSEQKADLNFQIFKPKPQDRSVFEQIEALNLAPRSSANSLPTNKPSDLFTQSLNTLSGFFAPQRDRIAGQQFADSPQKYPNVIVELSLGLKKIEKVEFDRFFSGYLSAIIKYLGLVLAIALAVLSRSSGALVNIAILTIVLSILKIAQLNFHQKFIAIVGALAFMGIATVLISADPEVLFTSMGKSSDLTGRDNIWEVLLDLLSTKSPILGFGYGAFWEKYKTTVALQAGWNVPDAHNGFLDLALSVGLLGLILFALGYLITLTKSFVQFCRNPIDDYIYPTVILVYILWANIGETGLFTANNIYWLLYATIGYSLATSIPKKALSQKIVRP